MKKIFFILIITLLPLFAAAQNGTIKGFVYNLSDGEPIMFANIIIDKTTIGTSTNELGFFVLNKLPKGQYTLKIQSLGFADTTIRVNLENEKTLNIKIELQPQAKMLENIEISAEQEITKTEARVSVKKITATDIQKIPSIGGQADIAQYIQVLPGVVFSGDQGGQLYIRGGSAIQNKVLLDGMIIYNPFHSIGLFSVFETDIIRNADVYTGGFNAKYGGRLSSVMDITTRDGNKKQTSGKLSLSTFGGSAIIEGPIVKENEQRDYSVSYLLTAKNSYLSKTSGSIYNYIDTELPYDFFDIYGKMTLASKTGSKLNVFGFNFTDDVKGYKNIADFSWQNTGIGANILLVPQNSQSIVQAMTAYSKYSMDMNKDSNSPQKSSISSFAANIDATRFYSDNQMRFGVDMMTNTTNTLFENQPDEVTNYSTDVGAYIIFRGIVKRFLYEPSIRVSYYTSLDEIKFEPRLSMKYNVTDKFRLKAALGKYSQTLIDTKSDRDIVNLFTGYLTADPDLPKGVVSTFKGDKVTSYVETSNHFIVGAEYDIMKHLTVNIEAYYKTMSNLISVNRDRLYDIDPDHADYPEYLKKNFNVENATAWGGDISLKYTDGRLYVWAIYSLGHVEKESEIRTYFPHYDRRHNVNVLASYQLGLDRSWEISVRWNYGSGFPFTATAGFGQVLPFSDGLNTDFTSQTGSLTTLYGELNGQRLPSYHRLDVSAKKRFNIFKRSILEIEASITNLYDRNNLFYYDRITSQRVDQLPIMPSVGMTWKF